MCWGEILLNYEDKGKELRYMNFDYLCDNAICRIQIDHIIGLIKSVRSVLCAAVCRGSVWRPCLFVYVVARPIFCTKEKFPGRAEKTILF